MAPKKIIIVVGARPNYMKAAPLLEELRKRPEHKTLLVHTGQHYDAEMSDIFFNQMDLPEPDIRLGVGSGTHAEQTGRIMMAFERVCMNEKPQLIIVVGDVNSTLACALVAAKLGIPVAHVEAGLRSHDRSMPEEINRMLTDQISDFLFTTCKDANQNLVREGIPESKIFFVGNLMIDSLVRYLQLSENSDILGRLDLNTKQGSKAFALVTLHRPSNVDDPVVLKGLIETLIALSKEVAIIFPTHPRTRERIEAFRFAGHIHCSKNISCQDVKRKNQGLCVIPPIGYIDFLCLMSNALLVLTDSGGIQEETTFLGIPCLTLRDNTERPVTIREGTNILVGQDSRKILTEARQILKNGTAKKSIPKYWDGRAAGRVVQVLVNHF